MPHSPTPSDPLLSLRTSCDRCRSQKLKCTVLKSPNRSLGCQRCARAMVPCVFGRRNKNKRSESASKASHQQPPAAEAQEIVPTTPPHITYPDVLDGGMGTGEPLLLHGADAFPFYDTGLVLSTEQVFDGKSDTIGQIQRGVIAHMYQGDDTVGDLKLFGYDIPCSDRAHDQDHAPTSHPEPGPRYSTSEWNSSSSDSDPFAEFLSASKPRTSSAALLHFAANLHEKLEMLENEPSWRQENARMDDYPIGSILELSKKLQNLGVAMQMSRCNDQLGSVVQANGDMTSIESEQPILKPSSVATGEVTAFITTASPRFETSASLILLSCYVTMLQICTAVMGHFQDYLMVQPNLLPRAQSTSVPQTPLVCLGDLVPLNQSHDRMHTAIYMLLRSLEQVEEALCLPSQVRYASNVQFSSTPGGQIAEQSEFPFDLEQRNLETALMHWGLFSNTGGIQGILSDFGRKVKETKEMLRHHMDL